MKSLPRELLSCIYDDLDEPSKVSFSMALGYPRNVQVTQATYIESCKRGYFELCELFYDKNYYIDRKTVEELALSENGNIIYHLIKNHHYIPERKLITRALVNNRADIYELLVHFSREKFTEIDLKKAIINGNTRMMKALIRKGCTYSQSIILFINKVPDKRLRHEMLNTLCGLQATL